MIKFIECRIYTKVSEIHRRQIESHVLEHFDSFTMLKVEGHWNFVVEIICDAEDKESVLKIASWIKTTFEENFVVITEKPVSIYTIGKLQ